MSDPLNPSPATVPVLLGLGQVKGAVLFNGAGEKLGRVEDVALEARTGRVAYVLLAFGGFLGLGGRHLPVPWAALSYDPLLGGFVAELDPAALHEAPSLAPGEAPPWGDEAWRRRLHEHYRVPPLWDSVA